MSSAEAAQAGNPMTTILRIAITLLCTLESTPELASIQGKLSRRVPQKPLTSLTVRFGNWLRQYRRRVYDGPDFHILAVSSERYLTFCEQNYDKLKQIGDKLSPPDSEQ